MEFKFYKIPWCPDRYNDPTYCLDVVNETMELILDLAYGDYTEDDMEQAIKEIASFMKILSMEQSSAYSELVGEFSFYLGQHYTNKLLMFPAELGVFMLKRGVYEYE